LNGSVLTGLKSSTKVQIVTPNPKKIGFSNFFLSIYQVAILIAVPAFLLIHIRQRAPLRRFFERFGFFLGTEKTLASSKPTIWFHAASLGEVKQIQSLAKRLHQEHKFNVIVTTFTQAGAEWVQQNLSFATHKFAPIDIHFFTKRFLRKFNPQSLVIIEGDIWPILLHTANKRQIAITLLNARSSKSRKRFPLFYTQAISYLNTITCPSQNIQNEFLDLGIDKGKVTLIDSLKAAQQNVDADLVRGIQSLALDRKILVIASTHASDEALALEVIDNLQSAKDNYFVIWAPRHLRRTTIISQKLASIGIDYINRSDLPVSNAKYDTLILDTLGELATALSISYAVYLGGGLGSEGGHNPFEPAFFGSPIATGPNIENHKQAFDLLMPSKAIFFIDSAQMVLDFFFTDHKQNADLITLSKGRFKKSVDETLSLLLDI
jgi:3-deoxy-D-manno-octulosonic-acid transferase